MSIDYLLRESLHSLRANPLRSGLSIIGVVFGVASVVAMLSVGLGAESEIEKLLDALGAGNLHITADELDDSEWNRVLKATVGLSSRDLAAAKSLLAGRDDVDYALVAAWRAGDASQPLPGAKLDVYGVTPNYRGVLGAELAAGRSFSPREASLGRPLCLIGETLARTWFGDAAHAVGQALRIERSWFTVVGVLAGRGEPQAAKAPAQGGAGATGSPAEMAGDGAPESRGNGRSVAKPGSENGAGMRLLALDDAVVMPLDSAERRLGPVGALAPLERIIVKLPPDIDPLSTRARIARTLSRLHRGAKVVTVTAADEVIEQKRSTTRLFSYFLMTIALISLVVGGIGIANVMLAGMVERIREVGLRRALGAKRRHILWQFLTEALSICLLGGLAGGFVGMAVSVVIGRVTGWNVAFPWWGHGVAVAIATAVGIGSGLYPAVLASRISPIEALQGRA